MAQVVDPLLIKELKALGAGDIEACFNCGNCTAVCPLSVGETVFPRKMIRYAQLGLQEQLVTAPEPWLCYYCGECSTTCPRQAGPGEFMAAARRYAIAAADPSGLSGWLYRSTAAAAGFTLLLAAVLGLFLVSLRPRREFGQWLFRWIPYDVIHTVGMIVGAILVLLLLIGVVNTIRRYLANLGGWSGLSQISRKNLGRALLRLIHEVVWMPRHGQCQEKNEKPQPWFLTARFVHWTMMWGFLGLGVATTLDFLFIFFLGWTFFLPARIVGTIGGLLMLYGVSISMGQRRGAREPHVKQSAFSDWWLLGFLFVLAVTGFWLEVVVTWKLRGNLHEVVLLVHTVMAMELVLLVTMTKLAHSVYRPLALLVHFIRSEPSRQT
jgi:quinone-modifying oxidoreductase subunit QmoC